MTFFLKIRSFLSLMLKKKQKKDFEVKDLYF